MSLLLALNSIHDDIQGIFIHKVRTLLDESNHKIYVATLNDYIKKMLSAHMFVRVERPKGSKQFVIGYMPCNWVFSFAKIFEKLRIRLNDVPPMLLIENEVNNALRLTYVGMTDYEYRDLLHMYSNSHDPSGVKHTPLNAALEENDFESVKAMLKGGTNPNDADSCGRNGLHSAACYGCPLSLFHIIINKIDDINTGNKWKMTALMFAANNKHLELIIALMEYPDIDLNVKGFLDQTVLDYAIQRNSVEILSQLLSDDRIDISDYKHLISLANLHGRDECAKILREHKP